MLTVALLQTLAKMSGASSSVLGLTLLALGNASSKLIVYGRLTNDTLSNGIGALSICLFASR